MVLGVLLIASAFVAPSTAAQPANESKLEPALVEAIRHADIAEMKRLLVDQPAQLEARDGRGWTPLMHAAFYADEDAVQLLLEQGAHVLATNQAGATALHYAATDLEKVRLLVKAGADANASSNLGNTPLMLAVRSSRSSPVVRLLLGNRADVHARNIYGATALMIAASSDDVETVKLLLDRDAKPSLVPYATVLNPDGQRLDPIFGGGYTALSWASIRGNLEIAQLLMESGADVNGRSMFGLPLTSAALRNQTKMARLLLQHGAHVDAIAPVGGWTPLMWAAANEYGDADLVKLLIEHGADVNAQRGSWGPLMGAQSPLMIAGRRGQTPVVELLRQAGAKETADSWGSKTRNPPAREVSADQIQTPALLASLAAALPLLERTAVESMGEFAAHGQRCISCHHQLLPLVALSTAKTHGIPHSEQAIEKLVGMLRPPAGAGDASIAEVTFDPSPASFGGYALWGLASEKVAPYFVVDASVHSAAVYQSEDGSWMQPFPRPPITDSEFSSTALGVRALTLYPLPGRKSEMDERIARARDWLRRADPRTNEEHAYKLLGLHWAGAHRNQLAALATELVSLQRQDGGWAQLPGLSSDAYATGQTLYALQQAAGLKPTDEAIRHGIAYLLRTQLEDGSWFVRRRAYPFQPTMDAKFPHGRDAWISTAATCWSVMALSVGLDKQDVTEALRKATPTALVEATPRSASLPKASTRDVDFEEHILPMLENSCLDCHSSSAPAGKYALDSRESLIAGGFSGPSVVVPGNSAESLLVHHVAGLIEDVEMPPLARRDEYEPLSTEQIGLLRAWIDQGLPGLDE